MRKGKRKKYHLKDDFETSKKITLQENNAYSDEDPDGHLGRQTLLTTFRRHTDEI